jgi:hypothetical protein
LLHEVSTKHVHLDENSLTRPIPSIEYCEARSSLARLAKAFGAKERGPERLEYRMITDNDLAVTSLLCPRDLVSNFHRITSVSF